MRVNVRNMYASVTCVVMKNISYCVSYENNGFHKFSRGFVSK